MKKSKEELIINEFKKSVYERNPKYLLNICAKIEITDENLNETLIFKSIEWTENFSNSILYNLFDAYLEKTDLKSCYTMNELHIKESIKLLKSIKRYLLNDISLMSYKNRLRFFSKYLDREKALLYTSTFFGTKKEFYKEISL